MKKVRYLVACLLGVALFAVWLDPGGVAPGSTVLADEIITHTTSGSIETWHIAEPKVTQPTTDYKQITFQPGDAIVVTAGGCVQTGGTGDTWKRYVNPSGGDADRLYHGLIDIPGVTPGLVRIEGWHDRTLLMPQTIGAMTYLQLGYEDDDYGDNGYWGHDDGNDGQCRLDRDGGPAYVTVTITHNPSPGPTGTPRPMDLVATTSGFDRNWLPLSPEWGYQLNHPASLPDPESLCHYFAVDSAPNFGCTQQAPAIDSPTNFNSLVCDIGVGGMGVDGHINWGAATYTGTLSWSGHSIDDDYDFYLTSPRQEGVVAGRTAIKLEFDSEEVIDRFQTPWWNGFHQAVDVAEVASHYQPPLPVHVPSPGDLINGADAIVTGLIGLDREHGTHTELHPVWAMAVRVKTDPADETWAIFARNWGDEGFCSNEQHFLPLTEVKITLPWRSGAQAVTVNQSTQFRSSVPLSSMSITAAGGEGVLLTLPLTPPGDTRQPIWDGELHLHWIGVDASTSGTQARPTVPPCHRPRCAGDTGLTHPPSQVGAPGEGDGGEEMLDSLLQHLTPQQFAVYRRSVLPRRAADDRYLVPSTQIQVQQQVHLPQAGPPRRIRIRPTTGPNPRSKVQREQSALYALNAAYGGTLPLLKTRRLRSSTYGKPLVPFLDYWRTKGGVAQFGHPLTDLFTEVNRLTGQARTVQYFERAEFEYHPENKSPDDVLLSPLGAATYQAKYPGSIGAPGQMPNKTNGHYFRQTHHWVGGRFWQYWRTHGGFAQLGYPLSDEFTEVNRLTGQARTVQYFERAEFEYHPENKSPDDVLLSPLGADQFTRLYGGT